MAGNKEFLILFIPFLVISIITLNLTFFSDLNMIIKIITGIIGLFCLAIDIFALLVQYVNWKYYGE